MNKGKLLFKGGFFFVFLLAACEGGFSRPSLEITEAAMSLGIDADGNPVEVTSEFPLGTETVYCSFSWKGGKPGLTVLARWHYTSGDIRILDTTFNLTRVSDRGVLSLKMPPGKPLPAGEYRLDIESKGKVLKSVSFTVSSK